MLSYQYIWEKPSLFQNTLGISKTQFKKLLKKFTPKYTQIREYMAYSFTRVREPGGGRHPKVFNKPSKLLFFILFYIRLYPTFRLAQLLFELDPKQLVFWTRIGLMALEITVKKLIPLPVQQTKTLVDVFGVIPELKEHILDATEQPINRPKYNQEEYYSGKKKRHTIKRQVICTPDKRLTSISTAVSGKVHDKTLAEESLYLAHAPPNSKGLADSGYQGLEPLSPGTRIIKPNKKPRKRVLTQSKKDQNRQISSVRVRVEHVIGHLKYCRIFSDKIRYRKNIHNRISNIVGGLYNFKLDLKN